MKLILNLILVPIPEIGVNGAAIASVVCHIIAFSIAITALRKNIKLNLTFSKFVIKPIISVAIMAICSYFIYYILLGIITKNLAIILSILFAGIIYLLAILSLKIFSKEEILVIPKGDKVYEILKKLKIY